VEDCLKGAVGNHQKVEKWTIHQREKVVNGISATWTWEKWSNQVFMLIIWCERGRKVILW